MMGSDVESLSLEVAQLDAATGIGVWSSSAALSWKDLTVSTRKGSKQLLKGVSGKVDAGLCAIMGPSGSGKSTLINALAMRMDPMFAMTGETRINGHRYTSNDLKRMSGYVMQDDALNGLLTVQETLEFAAQLRCPTSFTPKQREERITRVLSDVGLTNARNTLVGSPLRKGLSGGERKRLSVALELLSEPRLLFLDEPTSGLDSMTALSLVRMLQRLSVSNGGCTTLCTIHQPQAKIFNTFDDLILLQSGSIVYQGPTSSAQDHFASIGFPCPMYQNPADHFMDLISPAVGTASSCSLVGMSGEAIKASYREPDMTSHDTDRPLPPLREQVPWSTQFLVLVKRSAREQQRRWRVLLTQLLQSVVMAVLIGTVFLQIGTNQSSTTRRQPLLFFCVINQGIFSALVVINSFPAERVLVLRERAAGTYYASAYFLAKTSVESVWQIVCPLVFSCVVYFLTGLQPTAPKFLIFASFMCLCSLSATSMALAVSAWCRTTDLSTTVLPMVLEVARLFGGFFLAPVNLPLYYSWLDALSYVKYTYVGISLNELHGLDITCTPAQLTAAGGVCPTTSGEQVIERLGLNYISIGGCAAVLLAFVVVTRTIAYLGVRCMKW